MEDEISAWFGVGEDVLITWSNEFVAWQTYYFATGKVTMPCFYDSVMYVKLTEKDAM